MNGQRSVALALVAGLAVVAIGGAVAVSTGGVFDTAPDGDDPQGPNSTHPTPLNDSGTHIDANGSRLTLEAAGGQVVRGSTDRPDGTKLVVRIQSTDGENPFLLQQPTTVDDGRFRTQFDLSETPTNATVDVSVHHNGTRLAKTDGVVTGSE